MNYTRYLCVCVCMVCKNKLSWVFCGLQIETLNSQMIIWKYQLFSLHLHIENLHFQLH